MLSGLLADAALFTETTYVMPEGWWATVGICGGIVLPLIVFAIVFLASVLPKWRRLAKEGVSALAETGQNMQDSPDVVMEDALNDGGAAEGAAPEEYEKKKGDCIVMSGEIEEIAEEEEDERLDRSFVARLILADDDTKQWYSTLKNAALSYKGAKSSMAWKQEKLRCGRKQIGKLLIRGKVLCLYLNLTMDDLKDCKTNYRVEDMSGRAINAATPLMYRIKNPLRVRHAIDLIGMVAEKLDLVKAKKFQPVDYAASLGSKTEEELIEMGLIRKAPQTQYETFTPAKD